MNARSEMHFYKIKKTLMIIIQFIKKIDQQNKLTFFLSLSKTQKMLGVQKMFFSLQRKKTGENKIKI